MIVPLAEPPEDEKLWAMVRAGLAKRAGGKPHGLAKPVRIRGKPISKTVIEGRR
ncbi:MAG: hypothetical protein ACREJ9_05810 [Candidatus Rokuibacteriota bacterium]